MQRNISPKSILRVRENLDQRPGFQSGRIYLEGRPVRIPSVSLGCEVRFYADDYNKHNTDGFLGGPTLLAGVERARSSSKLAFPLEIHAILRSPAICNCAAAASPRRNPKQVKGESPWSRRQSIRIEPCFNNNQPNGSVSVVQIVVQTHATSPLPIVIRLSGWSLLLMQDRNRRDGLLDTHLQDTL